MLLNLERAFVCLQVSQLFTNTSDEAYKQIKAASGQVKFV